MRLPAPYYENFFASLNQQRKMRVNESFEGMSMDELKTYNAIILPSGYVTDNMLWLPMDKMKKGELPEMSKLLIKAFQIPDMIVGSIWFELNNFLKKKINKKNI